MSFFEHGGELTLSAVCRFHPHDRYAKKTGRSPVLGGVCPDLRLFVAVGTKGLEFMTVTQNLNCGYARSGSRLALLTALVPIPSVPY